MARVLIVDDEIDTLNLLRAMAEIGGNEVLTTLHAQEALGLAQTQYPDIILLDVMMPEIDGFTLCKMMRLHPNTMHVPIAFITAYSGGDIEAKRIQSGADLVIPKPITMNVLRDTIDKAIALKEAGTIAKPIPPAPDPKPPSTPATLNISPDALRPNPTTQRADEPASIDIRPDDTRTDNALDNNARDNTAKPAH